MQRCANCGAALPDDARFCGTCGTVPPPPQANPWPQQPQQTGGWPQQQPPMPQASGWPQPTPAQQPSQAGGWSQPAPVQQPLSQNGSWQQPPAQAGGWPQPPSEQFYAQQAAPSAQPMPPMSPVPQMPPGGSWQQQPPFMPPPGGGGAGTQGRRSAFPRWIFIALIAVLVIGGGVTAFALLNHHPNQPGSGPGANTVATSGATKTAVVNSTPVLGGGSPLPTATVIPNCQGGISRTGSFSFSGTVSGRMTVAQFVACGPITVSENGLQVKEYVGMALGTIGAATYKFIFGAFPYNNPGTFQSVEVVGRLTDTGGNRVWQDILAAAPGTITINADGKSGSLSITMPESTPTIDPNNTVKVTGTWSS